MVATARAKMVSGGEKGDVVKGVKQELIRFLPKATGTFLKQKSKGYTTNSTIL